jgi:hypothetical protein
MYQPTGTTTVPHERQTAMNEKMPSASERIIAGVCGLFFGGIGLGILGGNLESFGEFHSPPLFFRFVGILMSLPPLAIGAMFLFAAITGKAPRALAASSRDRAGRLLGKRHRSQSDQEHATPPGTYTCPRCAAPLNSGTDVSPNGDVKCNHCGSWFNVRHGG